MSTRYDARLVAWAMSELGLRQKSDLVKRALDDLISRLVKDAA